MVLLAPLGRRCGAQVFEPGYLVLGRGDTLRGEVENAFWTDPPKAVRFRPAATAPVVSYRAVQLRAVQLASGRLLRRELLPIDYSASKNPNQMFYGLVIRQRPDSLLADVLVEGPATLLSVVWGQVQHFFVRREQQPYLEMTERRYLDNNGGVVSLRDGNNYQGQLGLYFGDCAAAVAATNQAKFTATDLIGVVQTYNQQCSAVRQPGRRIEVEAPKASRVKLQVGPLLGVRYTSMRLRAAGAPGLEAQTLAGQQLDGRLHLQPGLYFDLLDGGRRLAAHTALYAYRVGRQVEVAAPDGSAQWRGTLDWRATAAVWQVGLRGLLPVGPHYTLLAGAGAEIAQYWAQAARLRYGTGTATTRLATGGVAVLTEQPFQLGFARTKMPYLEVGIRRQRLTALLTGRIYGKQHYYDPLVVAALQNPAGQVYSLGHSYTARTLSAALVLSYQLNRDTDQRK
ncbi:hypothetical protein DLM85_10735 [Hymenobacter edaphi]|uniref:Uncharacterized protein n=2 Tax=Hymenobacter edaphi TaxID=2211146 RepID=A0A328BNV5_9BACT|nr:hypothetical protein DLM85_10735 [Hymenobacter edaphi]